MLALYPLVVWGGIVLFGVRVAGLATLAALVLLAPFRLRFLKGLQTWEVAGVGGAITILVLLSSIFEDQRLLLVLPVLINMTLLIGFASSLLENRTPIVQRFARATEPDLSPAQVSYCRNVTKIWCMFFVFNAAIAMWLALFGSLEAWALYTGGIAYLLMGALFLCEYGVRKRLFG